jgi:hypothetical protein
MRTRLAGMVAGVVLGASVLAAPAATAQEPGVHVEPNSPAGREYAIPFAQARNDANPGNPGAGDSGPGGSADAAPAFGSGVRRSAGKVRRGDGFRNVGKVPGGRNATTPSPAAGATPGGTPERSAFTGTKGTPGSLIVICLAVVAAGLLAGIAARRASSLRTR